MMLSSVAGRKNTIATVSGLKQRSINFWIHRGGLFCKRLRFLNIPVAIALSSSAASEVLTCFLGDNVGFIDTSEVYFGIPERKFHRSIKLPMKRPYHDCMVAYIFAMLVSMV